MDREIDERLVRALLEDDPAGRREALGALYERHSARVFNVALRVTGSRDKAMDVVQEVFLSLPARARSFRGEASFTSWLYRLTVNRAIDRRRWEARRRASSLGDLSPDAEEGAFLHGGSESADSRLERGEEADRVQAALLRLSPKLRAVAVLRYLEGLTYEELAEALDCSIGTVKSRLNRAHAALARALGRPPPPSDGPPGE
jgi:RNA polymerase sigma-70 factor (ECF subfamily)